MSKRIVPALLVSLCLCSCGDPTEVSGPPSHLFVFNGGNQTGIVGQPTPIVPAALVLDDNNRPIAGVAVTFTVTPGHGTITTANATTDGKGVATPGAWTLPNALGTKTLSAATSALPPITFTARAQGSPTGTLGLNLTDAPNDTLPKSGTGTPPRAHDVTSVRAEFRRDSLVLTVTFANPVAPSSPPAAASLAGFIELDIDDNRATGTPALSNGYGASAQLGIDFLISVTSDGATMSVYNSLGTTTATVPVTFAGNTVTIRIPMSILGDDDGSFALVGTIGTADRPTDIFPNSGGANVRLQGQPAILAGPSGAMTPTTHRAPALSKWREMQIKR